MILNSLLFWGMGNPLFFSYVKTMDLSKIIDLGIYLSIYPTHSASYSPIPLSVIQNGDIGTWSSSPTDDDDATINPHGNVPCTRVSWS